MPYIIRHGNQYRSAIPVDLIPHSHSLPSCNGTLLGKHPDMYHFGAEVLTYSLSDSDKLIIIASHKGPQPHLILITQDAQLIDKLPSKQDASLLSKLTRQIQRYLTHSYHYPQPVKAHQLKKRDIAQRLLTNIQSLYPLERSIAAHDALAREQLRNTIIGFIESARDANHRLANHPFVSPGQLESILYQCKRDTEDYEFNPFRQVKPDDQYTDPNQSGKNFIWDSICHLTHSHYSVDDCLQTIARHYELKRSYHARSPNRIQAFQQTISTYHQQARDFADYCLLPHKPRQSSRVVHCDNVCKTYIEPYYQFISPDTGLDLQTLPASTMPVLAAGQTCHDFFKEHPLQPICLSSDHNMVYIRPPEDTADTESILSYRCFIAADQIHLLPSLDDLIAVTKASERHLYFPERAWIHFKLFFNHIPAWFKWIYFESMRFAKEEVYDQIIAQVHRGHDSMHPDDETRACTALDYSEETIRLTEEKSLVVSHIETFSCQQYVFTQPAMRLLPTLYNNPLHRLLNLGNHAASFFVGLNETNPILGTMALSAYVFAALSVAAPASVKALLTQLHMQGLGHLIPIIQGLGALMSKSQSTQIISASMTLWQLTMLAGHLDKASLVALEALKKNPAAIIAVATLTMSTGYVLCNIVPFLQHEMGVFPYTQYFAVGAKSGAALFDTFAHPGDDWLLGTIKWMLKACRLAAILLIAPLIEGFYYGWHRGFMNGIRKSKCDVKFELKQILAAMIDLVLLLSMFLFKHGSALVFHVPFRGITGFLSRSIAAVGHTQDFGNALLSFSANQAMPLASFRLSPFYGFNLSVKTDLSNDRLAQCHQAIAYALYSIWFMIKDCLLLPLTDMASYSFRLCLTLINQLSKPAAWVTGYLILGVALIIDRTIGGICIKLADAITQSANFIDNQAGQMKRQALSQAQVQRHHLYRWAFANEESNFQKNRQSPSPAERDIFYQDYLDQEMPVSSRV